MTLYAIELFEKYWKKRQYKHPEEKKEQRKIALKFFTAGFNTGEFQERLQEKNYAEYDTINNKVKEFSKKKQKAEDLK